MNECTCNVPPGTLVDVYEASLINTSTSKYLEGFAPPSTTRHLACGKYQLVREDIGFPAAAAAAAVAVAQWFGGWRLKSSVCQTRRYRHVAEQNRSSNPKNTVVRALSMLVRQ